MSIFCVCTTKTFEMFRTKMLTDPFIHKMIHYAFITHRQVITLTNANTGDRNDLEALTILHDVIKDIMQMKAMK